MPEILEHNPEGRVEKKKFYKTWWFWLLVVVIIIVMFAPYLCISAQCKPCISDQYCPPCPNTCYGLVGYIISQL